MKNSEMSGCEWEERVALFVGGDLDGAEALAVMRHLEGCAGCRVVADELAGLREGLAELAEVEEEAVATVHERVLERVSPRRQWWRWAAVAAAVVLAVAAGWMLRMDTGVVKRPTLAEGRGLGAAGAPEVRKGERVETGGMRESGGVASRKIRGGLEGLAHESGMARAEVGSGRLVDREARRGSEAPPHQGEELKMAVVGPGVVKMETEDPDVVIYWILEGTGD